MSAQRAQRHSNQQGQDRINDHRTEVNAQYFAKPGAQGLHNPNLVDLLADDGINGVIDQEQAQNQRGDGQDAQD